MLLWVIDYNWLILRLHFKRIKIVLWNNFLWSWSKRQLLPSMTFSWINSGNFLSRVKCEKIQIMMLFSHNDDDVLAECIGWWCCIDWMYTKLKVFLAVRKFLIQVPIFIKHVTVEKQASKLVIIMLSFIACT